VVVIDQGGTLVLRPEPGGVYRGGTGRKESVSVAGSPAEPDGLMRELTFTMAPPKNPSGKKRA